MLRRIHIFWQEKQALLIKQRNSQENVRVCLALGFTVIEPSVFYVQKLSLAWRKFYLHLDNVISMK